MALADLTHEDVVSLIERSLVESFAYFGKRFGRYETEADVTFFHTGIPFPFYNMVLGTSFPQDRAASRIDTILDCFKQKNALPMLWFTTPSSQPENLDQQLLAAGLVHMEENPGMALDLMQLQEQKPVPGLEVVAVENGDEENDWIRVLIEGYEIPEVAREGAGDLHRSLETGPKEAMTSYLGYCDGEPAGVLLLSYLGGVAGIYACATLPRFRRRGLCSSLLHKALFEARQRQERYAVLHASASGFGLYQKSGFQTYCKVNSYLWTGER